ncbi:MAG: cell envelope integrity protein CreD [Verrucomicrobiaceae bacterium]|nr:cell envelope integrity protein CreD [Verrucomicrobiaceae bacterium]
MTPLRLLSILSIIACTAGAWFVLGTTLSVRTAATDARLSETVSGNWGQPMTQIHPRAYYIAPTTARTKRAIQPDNSRIRVSLRSDPKKKGLLWYRTYSVDFEAEYLLKNPTPISQTIYVAFDFPAQNIRFDEFSFKVGDKTTDKAPRDGTITEALILEPGEVVPVKLTYSAAGLERWVYSFGEAPRVSGFQLDMITDFTEIDIPAGSESPTSRETSESGWHLTWAYRDVLGARSIAMEMPAVTNPGPVAARITFFAPVSLVFFFAVVIILGAIRNVNLHPMNYFLLASGCFAFQLLFAYLVDLIPIMLAFSIAAGVSLFLVVGYLIGVAGFKFARLAGIAQFTYMILFSYSFFFDGLTGITITIGAILTLALLMLFSAKTDWTAVFTNAKDKGRASVAGVSNGFP